MKRLSFTVNSKKKLDKTAWNWRIMADQLDERSYEGVLTDSQDKMDHGVQPMDLNVMSYKKK